MRIELKYHLGKAVRENRSVRLPSPAARGMSCVELSEPCGLRAAETTKTIGKSEKATASSPAACRQPVLRA